MTRTLLLAGAALCLAAAPAVAQPVVTGFAVAPAAAGHPKCGGKPTCMRVTIRVFDGSRLTGSKLRYRFIARHSAESGFRLNLTGTIENRVRTHELWLGSTRTLRAGTYLARMVVTGASTTKSPVRSFIWP